MDPTIEKALKLPKKQKIALLVAVMVLEAAGLYFGLYKPKQQEYSQTKEKLTGLRKEIEDNRKVAQNLPRYRADFQKLTKDLEMALTELPNQKEIPSLLTSITRVGKQAGVDFLVFRPGGEQPKEFYAAVPVSITVSGSFPSICNFFVAVANLPRIVNLSNINYSDIRPSEKKTMMRLNCQATTYRFITPQPKDKKK